MYIETQQKKIKYKIKIAMNFNQSKSRQFFSTKQA